MPDNHTNTVFSEHWRTCEQCGHNSYGKLCDVGTAAWWYNPDALAVGDQVTLVRYGWSGEIVSIDSPAVDERPIKVRFTSGSAWACFPGELIKRGAK